MPNFFFWSVFLSSSCSNHFGLSPSFSPSNLYVRNETGEAVRSIYYTSNLIKTIVTQNEYTRMRLISAGVKLFARQESPGDDVVCKWRACAEGLELLLPFLGEGKVLSAGLKDLKVLLETHYPMVSPLNQFEPRLPYRSIGSIDQQPASSLIFTYFLSFFAPFCELVDLKRLDRAVRRPHEIHVHQSPYWILRRQDRRWRAWRRSVAQATAPRPSLASEEFHVAHDLQGREVCAVQQGVGE